MNLGEKIYELRMKKNLSQGDLADRLQVSRQSVSKWENNTAVPDLDKLIKLCDVFEVSLDELTGREKTEEKPTNKLESFKNSLTKTQLVGCILIGVAVISALLPYGVFFTPSIIVCAIICLLVKRNAWYWCAWVVFLPLLFIIGVRLTMVQASTIIIEIVFLVLMAFATYKAFKDTEIVMSRKKAIIILVLSLAVDLLYILFHIWNMGCFGTPDSTTTVILDNGQTVTTGMATSGLAYGLLNIFLTAGVVLSWIGILLSVKNLRKNK